MKDEDFPPRVSKTANRSFREIVRNFESGKVQMSGMHRALRSAIRASIHRASSTRDLMEIFERLSAIEHIPEEGVDQCRSKVDPITFIEMPSSATPPFVPVQPIDVPRSGKSNMAASPETQVKLLDDPIAIENKELSFRLFQAVYDVDEAEEVYREDLLIFSYGDVILEFMTINEEWSYGLNITNESQGIFPVSFMERKTENERKVSKIFMPKEKGMVNGFPLDEFTILEVRDDLAFGIRIKKHKRYNYEIGLFPIDSLNKVVN